MPTLDDVSRIAVQLPGSEEKASGGGRAWFVRGKPYVWESMPWPSVPETLRVIVSTEVCIGLVVPDDEDKLALVQGWPDVFMPWDTTWGGQKLIIRLDAIDADHLTELVTESWCTLAPKYLRSQLEG